MAVDQESSDTTDSPAGSSGAVHSGPVPVRKGTTFETLAVCGFIFGLFAIVAAIFVLVNFLVDMSYALLDPRVVKK